MSDKHIAELIIDFLKSSVSNKVVSEDYSESMDVAIDCIADAFEVDKDSKINGKSLKELLEGSSSSTGASAAPKGTNSEVDEETKAKADDFKLQGNRAMAARNFDQAIDFYTKAIELNPYNVVYLSNRAAAYSSNSNHESAVKDSEAAIKLDPNFSKSYSRLGLAKYALGDAKAAMNAYKQGLEVEGSAKSDAMKRGYETAKKRVEEELEKSIPSTDLSAEAKSTETSSGSTPSAGGMPDLSSMFGGAGGAGGMPSLADMMNNPQIMQAAQQMMQNPEALQGLMNNPMLKNMAQNMGLGGENGQMPDMSELMNNPMLKNMANQFMGGKQDDKKGDN